MPGDYQTLAMIHDEIQMGEFAKQMTGRLLEFAQRNDWFGRQITDLGCGTGESLLWLTQHGYIVTGIDESTEMLKLTKMTLQSRSLNAQLVHGNFLEVDSISGQDMVLALNVLNEMNNLRELEQAFRQVNGMLRENKWFVFDFYTIEGLARRNDNRHELVHDDNQMTVFMENQFDYEKSIQSRKYTIFRNGENGWERFTAERRLRAYNIQGITALVKRSGFNVKHVLNMGMRNYSSSDSTERVLLFAEKE